MHNLLIPLKTFRVACKVSNFFLTTTADSFPENIIDTVQNMYGMAE